MFIRSILSSYYRLLAGLSLAVLAIVLTGCNETVAERKAGAVAARFLSPPCTTSRKSPERSFVGTIKPRIETDMGFRVPGKVAKAPGRSRPDRRCRPVPRKPSMKSI